MIIRLTRKLAKKIDSLDAMNNLLLAKNPYLDWSANLFRSERVQYIIITNTVSLYSMIMYGRGITDHSNFIKGVQSTFRLFMEAYDDEFLYRRFIVSDESPMMFAKSLNRSVTGLMNDLIDQAKFHLKHEELSPFNASFKLNESPMSYLNYENPKTAFYSISKIQDFKM